MRKSSKLLLGVGAVATLSTIAAPALAEPSSTPPANSIVAVGSDTIQGVSDAFQADYTGTPPFYSYDAIPTGTTITPKQGCSSINRPNGSGAGISALAANARTSDDSAYCIDIARSSRTLSSTDPVNLAGVPFALDGVTWSANSTTNAPADLSKNELADIYSCAATTWDQVGGTSTATITPVLPQGSSGTRSFFLSQIGVTTPGSCVTNASGTQAIEENEGTNSALSGPNVIFPYSIAVYLSQTEHGHTSANNNPGSLKLHSVGGVSPTSGKAPKATLNKKFPFTRDVYYVVRSTGKKAGYVPTYLQSFLGKNNNKGYVCGKAAAKDIADYGFLGLGSKCGKVNTTSPVQ